MNTRACHPYTDKRPSSDRSRIKFLGNLLPVQRGFLRLAIPQKAIHQDPEPIELRNVANEPENYIVHKSGFLCERTDPVAYGTASAHLIPVIPALFLVAWPPVDSRICSRWSFPCPRSFPDCVSWTMFAAFLTDLAILHDAFRGLWALGQGHIGEDLAYLD